MKTEEKETLPYLEIAKGYFENPDYKSELKIKHITIRLEKRFNWFNRLMFKIFFGVDITNIRK